MRIDTNGDYWKGTWTDTNGRTHSRSLGNRAKVTKREAMRKLTALVEKGAKQAKRAQRHELGDEIEAWLDDRSLSDSSQRAYEDTGRRLIEHFGKTRRVGTITRADAAAFRTKIADRGVAENTVRKHIRHARILMQRLVDTDALDGNPFDKEAASVREMDKDWRYVTLDELEKVLDACPGPEFRCVFALARLGGLRAGEIMGRWGLTADRVDWQARTMTVTRPGQKVSTKNRRRIVPISPRLYDILLERFEAMPEKGGRFAQLPTGCSRNTARMIVKIIERAGLEPWDKPLHTLRKNLETDWLGEHSAYDVVSWLGNSLTVALRHYHQTKPESLARVTEPAQKAAQTGEHAQTKANVSNSEHRT